jgi:NAD(P)-dependent dehydrogenase (short-subunit alcohol dehydrogenase family)
MASITERVTEASKRNKGSSLTVTSDQVADKLHGYMTGKIGECCCQRNRPGELTQKTVVITGVTPRSLGAEAARVIAKHDPKLLILASRTESTIDETIESIKSSTTPGIDLRPLVVDLGSQKSVRAAAVQILEWTPVVDVLINNAGIMMMPTYKTTPEGIELQFGVNHIGHFLFTNLLVPALLKSTSGGRVVNISSAGHRGSDVRLDDVNFNDGKDYEPFIAYAASKTANIQFSVALANKLGSKGLLSYSIDPGCKWDDPREVRHCS